MAERTLPSWKQLYDTVEKVVGPRIDEFARSEEVAALAALNKKGQTEFQRRLEQVSRRALHVLNLPAGSDMNRLLTHIAHLEREVRDLRKQVTDRNDAEFLESLATRRAERSPRQQQPEQRGVDEPVVEKPAAGKPAAKTTAAKKPPTKKTPTKTAATKRNVAKRNVAKKTGAAASAARPARTSGPATPTGRG